MINEIQSLQSRNDHLFKLGEVTLRVVRVLLHHYILITICSAEARKSADVFS